MMGRSRWLGLLAAGLITVPMVGCGPLPDGFGLPFLSQSQEGRRLSKAELEERARGITVQLGVGAARASGTLIGRAESAGGARRYYVLTNRHVVRDAQEIQIWLPDGDQAMAVVEAGLDPEYDLAVVSFPSSKAYGVATVRDPERLPATGEAVFVAGFPFQGRELTFLVGAADWVLDRSLQDGYRLGMSVEIRQGMSGGPVLDETGRLVGIGGVAANPVVDSGYVFADGERPDDGAIQRMRRLSWGIPLAALEQASPEIWQVLNPLQVPPGLVLGSQGSQMPSFLQEAHGQAAAITVQLKVTYPSGTFEQGSGTIIARQGDEYVVVTAKHVLQEGDGNQVGTGDGAGQSWWPFGRGEMEVLVTTGDGASRRAESKVVRLPGVDLAVVRFRARGDYSVAVLNGDPKKTLEEPLGGVGLVSGFVKERRFISSGEIKRAGLEAAVGAGLDKYGLQGYDLVYSHAAHTGMSGGPVLDRAGRLLGIHAAQEADGYNRVLGYSLGVPIQAVLTGPALQQVGLVREQLTFGADKLPEIGDARDFLRALAVGAENLKAPGRDAGVEDWIRYGNQLWRLGFQQEQAAQAFQRAIQMKSPSGSTQALAWFGLGMTRKAQGKYGDAATALGRATVLRSQFVEAWKERGWVMALQKNWPAAIRDFDRAIEIESDNYLMYRLRAEVKYNAGQIDGSIADYTEAIRIKPDYHEAYNNRGSTYDDQGKYEEAIADYTEALRIKPDKHEAYYNRGNAYDDQGKYEEAIADYTEALRIKPDNHEAYYNRGIAYKNQGKYEEAITDFTAALRIKPDKYESYLGRGIAYALLGNVVQAKRDAEEAQRLSCNRDAKICEGANRLLNLLNQ